jgi:transcriptional regulator with XRE-family HTH domain
MSDVLKLTLGARVRAARKRVGITQEALAAKVGKTPESISNIERGQHLPMLETLAALASTLGVPLAEFFGSDEEAGNSPKRVQLEAQLRELVRGLDDDLLATAVDQIEVLARAKRR